MKRKIEFYKLFKPLAEDVRLTLNDKLVAMYIYTLESFNKRVTASNSVIGNALNLSKDEVEEAVERLQYKSFISDLRKEESMRNLEIGKPQILKENYYRFYSYIIEMNLSRFSKFLKVYILSYENSNTYCYATNKNILKDLGFEQYELDHAIYELKGRDMLKVVNPRTRKRELRVSNIKSKVTSKNTTKWWES